MKKIGSYRRIIHLYILTLLKETLVNNLSKLRISQDARWV